MSAAERVKRVVLATDAVGGIHAIGPVFTHDAVDELRDLIEAAGWENSGVVTIISKAAWLEKVWPRKGRSS